MKLGLLLAGSMLLTAAGPKMTAEDVIARHLESLGTPEARANIRTRTAEGTAQMRVLVGGAGEVAGKAFVYGDPSRFRVALPFEFSDYWGEQLYSDAEKVDVGFVQPGERSSLGEFLRVYTLPLAEGLIGGVLSTRWPLLDVGAHQPRLDYRGLKKIDGREAHLIQYRSKRGRDNVSMDLYFDAATFRHLRSFYSVSVVSAVGRTIESSSQQQERRFSVEENFSDFQALEKIGVTLPMRWRIRCTIDSQLSSVREWDVSLRSVTHNAEIDPAKFVNSAVRR